MDSARPSSPNYLTLQEAANSLAVSIDVLIAWNEHDILKPTIGPTGEAVYTQEQIDKFLAIKKAEPYSGRENLATLPLVHAQTNAYTHEINKDKPYQVIKDESTHNYSQVNNYNFYTQPDIPQKETRTTISFKGIVATFSFFGIAALVVVFSQQSKFDSLLHRENLAYDTTNATLNESTSVDRKNKVASNNLNNEGDAVSEDNKSGLNKAFDKNSEKNAKTSKNSRDQVAVLQSILGKDTDKNIESGIKTDEVVTYGQRANFQTSSNCPTCSKNADTESKVFDTQGNIKVSKNDPSENELLASALGAGGASQSQALVRQNSSSAALFTFLILGVLCLYFMYSTRKQFAFGLGRADDFTIQPISFSDVAQKQKIIEIHQKTDGTVVLFFQGKEYKVSKPELDSESDKFIERLLQLSAGVKEIEYDSLADDKMAVLTPLSKIVTRLGFVGVKRDLFFPRTSKTRVLFRRYITVEDLFSMNLTVDQISDGFKN